MNAIIDLDFISIRALLTPDKAVIAIMVTLGL